MDNMRAELGLQHIGIIMDGNGRWAKKEDCPGNTVTARAQRHFAKS